MHGNLPALEAALAEIEREDPDVVLVGGDVSAGPFPAETLELLRTGGDGVVWIRGNADREPDAWCAAQLSDEQRAFLAGLPTSVVLDVEALGPVLFCHGSPRSDDEILTRATSDDRLGDALAGVGERVVVHGHTHMPYRRDFWHFQVVCPGSVGMPYGETGAHWALFGPGVALRRTEYDLDAAAARIRASGWPEAARFAEENVLTVPDADEAVELFERMARLEG